MKTINKTFLAAFGNKYTLEILSKEKICDIIDYEINQEDVLRELLKKHIKGCRTEALLNVETGEIEYHSFSGNNDLQQRGHLIKLYEIAYNPEEGLDIEDFLTEEEIEEAGDYPWEFIWELPDYEERLYDTFIDYWSGFDQKEIKSQIDKIYN